jgi:hypothetical protein
VTRRGELAGRRVEAWIGPGHKERPHGESLAQLARGRSQRAPGPFQEPDAPASEPKGFPVTVGRCGSAPLNGARRFENVCVVMYAAAPVRLQYSRSTPMIGISSDSHPVEYPLPAMFSLWPSVSAPESRPK